MVKTLYYGTTNPAKLEWMQSILKPLEIQGIPTLQEPQETGDSPIINASLKALAYYQQLKQPVFACDSGLYLSGVAKEDQPGVHVRVVHGKRLSDEEMIHHYTSLATAYGGRIKAQYRNAICLVINEHTIFRHDGLDIASVPFYLTNEIQRKHNQGFPLDSISLPFENETSTSAMGFRAFFNQVLSQD